MRTLIAALALAGHAGAALAALAVGAPAPDFELMASKAGNAYPYSLAAELKKGPVVLYFYPAAFTSGCTIEAHKFAEATDDFAALGASVVGVSNDDLATLKKFSVSECRSKFPVAADPEGKVIRAYDAKLPILKSTAKRISYVITPDGKVFYEYTSLSPEDHVANTLAEVKRWRATHPVAKTPAPLALPVAR